eukprot:237516-Hanusia_phi.AAC.1
MDDLSASQEVSQWRSPIQAHSVTSFSSPKGFICLLAAIIAGTPRITCPRFIPRPRSHEQYRTPPVNPLECVYERGEGP